mmetsp:Transcript_25231/g.58072  ORF Transcript_25231/g.58072 Transcript_25231/m.58072 type:complete len:455 (+) Transcript_25231:96-1460(+)
MPASKGYSKGGKASGKSSGKGGSNGKSKSRAPQARGSAGGSYKEKNSRLLDGARSRVTKWRVNGTLADWKGGHGWIEPDRPIDHPEASKHKGRVFMAHKDVEEEIDGVGAAVSFFVYKDTNGLGAEQVRPARAKAIIPKYDNKYEKKSTPQQRPQLTKEPKGSAAKNAGKDGAAQARGSFAQRARAKAIAQKEPKEQVAPDASSREAVLLEPITGTCSKSFGKVAFITPDQAIDHPMADQRKGSIYVHQQDVEGDEVILPGAKVEFTVYTDEKGLGAENLRILSQGDGEQEAFGKNRRRDRTKKPQTQKTDTAVTKVGTNRGVKKVVKEEEKEAEERAQRKGGKSKGKGKGKQKPAGKKDKPADKGPSGPNLPRERIIDGPIVGEIVNWKRTFGWIKPAEDIDHDLFKKHEGRIYIHKKDITIEGDAKPEVGQSVQFYCYQDASGLGAEECMVL